MSPPTATAEPLCTFSMLLLFLISFLNQPFPRFPFFCSNSFCSPSSSGIPYDSLNFLSLPSYIFPDFFFHPFPGTFFVDSRRYDRSLSQKFFLLDTEDLFSIPCVLHLIGSRGNLYTISISNGEKKISCNCPDPQACCKHILFIATIVGTYPAPNKLISFPMNSLIDTLKEMSPFRHLSEETNRLCLFILRGNCSLCEDSIDQSNLVLCNLCYSVSHCCHSHSMAQCPCCFLEWDPYFSDVVHSYRNFGNVLFHHGYASIFRHSSTPCGLNKFSPSTSTTSGAYITFSQAHEPSSQNPNELFPQSIPSGNPPSPVNGAVFADL